jgi:hypothetical protein
MLVRSALIQESRARARRLALDLQGLARAAGGEQHRVANSQQKRARLETLLQTTGDPDAAHLRRGPDQARRLSSRMGLWAPPDTDPATFLPFSGRDSWWLAPCVQPLARVDCAHRNHCHHTRESPPGPCLVRLVFSRGPGAGRVA